MASKKLLSIKIFPVQLNPIELYCFLKRTRPNLEKYDSFSLFKFKQIYCQTIFNFNVNYETQPQQPIILSRNCIGSLPCD